MLNEQLWCVKYITTFNGQTLFCTKWWTTEEAAKQHAAERTKKGDTNVKVGHYILASE